MTVGVGDVVRVVAEWDIPDGTIAQLVYHYLGVSGTTATDAQMATQVEIRLGTAWVQIAADIANSVLGSTIELYLWDFALNRWDGIATVQSIGQDGTSVTDMLAHGAAGLVKMFTSASRRQARKYVMGLTEGVVTDGTIGVAPLGRLALFAADLDNDIVAGGLTASFGTFNTEPTSPLYETFSVTSGANQAEAIIAYQRRRRPGTGI